jgi:DNA-directed RNA polymerase specialized sigma24 family protein
MSGAKPPNADDPKGAPSSECFPTTQWTHIIKAVQGGAPEAAAAALEAFCKDYRSAICNFFRRRGCDHHQAEDLTQEFFLTRILVPVSNQDGLLWIARQKKGQRFRALLCTVLHWFLVEHWRHKDAKKRKGIHIPLEEFCQNEQALDGEPDSAFQNEFYYDFALVVIQKAVAREEHSPVFVQVFRGETSQAQAAEKLGLSHGAFRVAFHRFRDRLGTALRAEVAKLVGPDQKDVKDEIAFLMALCNRRPL